MPKPVRASFEQPAQIVDPQKAMVNYIWLNERPDAPDKTTIQISLEGLDRAYENAGRYPQAQFRLWVDRKQFNPYTRYFFDSHVHVAAPPNLSVHELSDVPAYVRGNGKYFGTRPVWEMADRVDLLRLIVLHHVLRTTDAPVIAYADLDIVDIKLGSAKLAWCLKNADVAFAGTRRDVLENGYMCMTRKGAAEILPEMIRSGREMACPQIPGFIFDAFYDVATRHAHARGLNIHEREISVRLAPQMGHKIKRNNLYKELGLS